MRIPLWLHREWAIFLCANGAHVHCPHVSDSPYFNLRPTRRQARKATKMIDTQPCITEGEHIRSQRHLPASCPMSDQTVPRSLTGPDADDATGDASVRYLLVELPIDSQLDVETVHDQAQRDLAAWLATDADLVDTPAVTQVYPGDVVSPDAVPDEQPDAVLVVEDTPPDPLDVAVDLLLAASTALDAYRAHVNGMGLGRFGLDDLIVMEELTTRGDLTVTPAAAMRAFLDRGIHVAQDDESSNGGQWTSDEVADHLADLSLLQD